MLKCGQKKKQITPEQVRELYREGQKTRDFQQRETACVSLCQHPSYGWYDPDRIQAFGTALCTDLDMTRCEEFGKTAELLCHTGIFGPTRPFLDPIRPLFDVIKKYQEDWKAKTASKFFTEGNEDLGVDFAVQLLHSDYSIHRSKVSNPHHRNGRPSSSQGFGGIIGDKV